MLRSPRVTAVADIFAERGALEMRAAALPSLLAIVSRFRRSSGGSEFASISSATSDRVVVGELAHRCLWRIFVLAPAGCEFGARF